MMTLVIGKLCHVSGTGNAQLQKFALSLYSTASAKQAGFRARTHAREQKAKLTFDLLLLR